jgi:hypothetical protein
MRHLALVIATAAVCTAACATPPVLRGGAGLASEPISLGSPSEDAGGRPTGHLNIAVRWPARGAFRAQLIPTSANLIRIQVRDAGGDSLASAEIVRSGDESAIATASFALPSGTGRSVLIQAFRDLVPAPGVPPVAEGSATSVSVWPSTSTAVTVALVPAYGPVIFSMTPNGGPGSLLQIVGGNFQTGVLNVSLAGQSLNDFVTLRGDLLEHTVPPDAADGTVIVDVDGVRAARSFQVIRSISLASDAITGVTIGSTVSLQAEARTADGDLIENPVLRWTVDRPDPESALDQGAFTPLAPGTFVVRVYSGTVMATASVTTP